MQVKRAEQEIQVQLAEALRRAEEPGQRQRSRVEEERLHYLGMEQVVLTQLG